MQEGKKPVFWFVTGSQHLYGEESLEIVENNSIELVSQLNSEEKFPFPIEFKSVLTNSGDIEDLMRQANVDKSCNGIITWMHTFSPGKMWISGLHALEKPLLHLHTQYYREVPWETIDMDYMNLHQSAHGDREYGFVGTRLGMSRKVVAGYWGNEDVQEKIKDWMIVAAGYNESKNIRVARFGDNMRNVAVTDGDKIEAQIKFGWTVDYYGIGDLVAEMDEVAPEKIENLMDEYNSLYHLPASPEELDAVREQARIEIGLKSFLDKGGYQAFTTNFEDLHGMHQLPGLAVQRLMAQGYGFAGEGDWRTAALVRLMKVMAGNQVTSFMEDYTYHLEQGNEMVLGSHMLEICPTITATTPEVKVSPLSMGGKSAPARMVFDSQAGEAINVSIVELGGRFRMVINKVDAVQPGISTPELPVAKVLWKPQPSLSEAAEAWIYAGGAHHTSLSYALTAEQMEDFAELMNIECAVIDNETTLREFKKELKWNALLWK
ncbi:L-arabinose isomerase [Halobacillus halophilus]|uniref:L-arabinose isomerase n=1 Tax=Halobacillus halophilus TaxID=1570 RepID=UPI001CD75818|nr:L-arabinose isomerase [Halobacillus halophilus]MCA1011431.1 L-arabinose isomerase [Halobacillus halophilus]